MSDLEKLNQELEEKNLVGFWTFVTKTSYEPKPFFNLHVEVEGRVRRSRKGRGSSRPDAIF